MTSAQNRAPLLILSNSIYARRSDGGFYPGTVQTRHTDGYTVKFADGAVERVLEDKLTWVGFWDMPPWIWPKTPVIHPMSSLETSWETFRDRTMLTRDSDTGLKEQKFGSFSEQPVYESMSSELPLSETDNTDFEGSKADRNIPSHLLPEQTDSNQPRSSVLRISSNVLSKEGNLSGFLNISRPFPDESHSVDKSLHNPSQLNEKPSKDNRSDFETQFASLATGKSRQTTDTHESFEGLPDSDWPLQQVMYNYSLDRGRPSSSPDVDASYATEEEEEEMRMATAELEYYKKEFRRSSSPDCSPSVNPSHFISSPLPFFSPSFEIAFLNASAPAMPSSFRLHAKAKKKNEKKKCRKVYGIENRHFWCTQCRWKKACTRFKQNGFA